MSIPSAHVEVFRTHRATRYVDTCDIKRLASRGDIDDATLLYPSQSEPNVATAQPCLYRPDRTSPGVTEFGQQGISRVSAWFEFADDAPELQVEDTITMITSVSSPKLVGKIFRVTGVYFDSYQTHMHVDVENDQGPGETLFVPFSTWVGNMDCRLTPICWCC